MLENIFKQGSILELISNNLKSLFNKDKNKSQNSSKFNPLEEIRDEIKRQKDILQQKESIEEKHKIQKVILHLMLKECNLLTSNKYIKQANEIINIDVEDTLFDALDYLSRLPKNLDSNTKNEIYLYRALIYEILEEYDEATKEYKKALSLNTTEKVLRRYKAYIQRTKEVLSWHKSKSKDINFSSYNIHNITKIEDMPKVAEKLDKIAKYYARSPKSRNLGKRYHREVIKLYKILASKYPKDYTCAYINALLEGVELFMLSPKLLQEAQELLYKNYNCIKSRVALTSKLKELKKKTFIKKAIVGD